MNKFLLSDYTTVELKEFLEKEEPIVIVSVGATEQHGPHLPLNTDADLGYNIALELAANCQYKTIITPPVWMGFSHHHMDFCGTISIKQQTLFHLVFDIIESLLAHGFKKIVLMNSHGGNTSILKTVIDEIKIKLDASVLYFTYWHLLAKEIKNIRKSPLNGMAHAGELETSLKYYFQKDKEEVRRNLIQDVMLPEESFYNVDMFAANTISLYRSFKEITDTGQIGQPSSASKETGEKLMEVLIKEFNDLTLKYW